MLFCVKALWNQICLKAVVKKSPVPFSATVAFRPTAFTGRALIKGTAVVPGFEERRGYEVLHSKDKKERVHPNE